MDKEITLFCDYCGEVSVTVHSKLEAEERYGWYREVSGEGDTFEFWYCKECWREWQIRQEGG